MNCAGVTCLSCVYPSGRLTSLPSYLAEINFQVPTSLLSPLGSPAAPAAAIAANARIAAIRQHGFVAIGLSSKRIRTGDDRGRENCEHPNYWRLLRKTQRRPKAVVQLLLQSWG